MKIGVIQFPGSNCERETNLAIQRAGMQPVNFLWNQKLSRLSQCAGFVLVGGFSYEDRARAGAIAAVDPVLNYISKQVDLGKPVLGICNGAQILLESGLVPGAKTKQKCIALTHNKRIAFDKVLGTGYYNAWVNLKLADSAQQNVFTLGMTERDKMTVPIAHAEGRFVMSEDLLEQLTEQGMIVLQYCTSEGEILDQFPTNPNGSMANIAAISNYAGNVLAMMPHPERCTAGDTIFASMRDFIVEQEKLRTGEFNYEIEPAPIKVMSSEQAAAFSHAKFNTNTNSNTSSSSSTSSNSTIYPLIIDQVLIDNEALSVQLALNKLAIPVTIKRYQYWQVETTQLASYEQVLVSEALFNPRKEYRVDQLTTQNTQDCLLLVQPKEDCLGQEKLQLLANHFEVNFLQSIQSGVLWHISFADAEQASALKQQVLASGLLYHPVAERVTDYSALLTE